MRPGLAELFSQSTLRWRPVHIYIFGHFLRMEHPLWAGMWQEWELNPPPPDTLPFTPPFLSSFCWNPHSNKGCPNSNKMSCGFSYLGDLGQVSCLSLHAAELLSWPAALVSGWGVHGNAPRQLLTRPCLPGYLQHGHHSKISENKAMSSKGDCRMCNDIWHCPAKEHLGRMSVTT